MDYNKLLGTKKKTELAKIRQFHGINQAMDESDLAAASTGSGCYTPKGVNFWIKNGNLTVRNNYEIARIGGSTADAQMTAITADNPDGTGLYTYKIVSLWAHTPNTGDTYLLAGVDALLNGAHHHYCLVHRKRDADDQWVEVKNSGTHALGTTSGVSVWFSSAAFTFANYSGDFFADGNDTETFSTCIANGIDIPMFYVNAGNANCLSVLGSSGWLNVTVDATANTFTTPGTTVVFSNDDAIELHSRTQQMPACAAITSGYLVSGARYYVVNKGGIYGTQFQLSLTKGGSPLDITTIGANMVIHMLLDYGTWVKVNASHNGYILNYPAPNWITANNIIQFKDQVPAGLSTSKLYKIINVSGYNFQLCDPADTSNTVTQFTSDSKNVQIRSVKGSPTDAPRGNNIMVYSDRLWMNVGDKIFYGAGVYDDPSTSTVKTLARPNDWSNAQYVGNVSEPSWDGETLNVMKLVNGKPFIGKPHSVYAVDGAAPPFTFRQIYNARGTTAPKSVCWHISGGLFEVTPEGILVFSGTATAPYASLEIQNIWKPDAHTGAIGTVVGDVLFVYGSYNRPDTGKTENGLIAINILTKDIAYWDMLSSSFPAMNAVTGGNFPSTAGWAASGAALSAASNSLVMTGNGTSASVSASQQLKIPYVAGHKIYSRIQTSLNNSLAQSTDVALVGSVSGRQCVNTINSPQTGAGYVISSVVTLPQGSGTMSIVLETNYASQTAANGKIQYAQYAIVCDLTSIFGNGHEPTAAQFEAILTANGFSGLWFDKGAVLTSLDHPGCLTVDSVLEPRFTLTSANSIPQFWFASGDMIFRLAIAAPAAGAAVPMTYCLPENDFGDASMQKHVSRLTITGSGGALTFTPTQDGTDKNPRTIQLPAKPVLVQVNGRRVKFKLASNGDPVVVRDIEQVYS